MEAGAVKKKAVGRQQEAVGRLVALRSGLVLFPVGNRTTVIGVLTNNYDAAGIARKAHRLDRGVRRAGRFDRHVGAARVGSF
jgi:hypothetical protein